MSRVISCVTTFDKDGKLKKRTPSLGKDYAEVDISEVGIQNGRQDRAVSDSRGDID